MALKPKRKWWWDHETNLGLNLKWPSYITKRELTGLVDWSWGELYTHVLLHLYRAFSKTWISEPGNQSTRDPQNSVEALWSSIWVAGIRAGALQSNSEHLRAVVEQCRAVPKHHAAFRSRGRALWSSMKHWEVAGVPENHSSTKSLWSVSEHHRAPQEFLQISLHRINYVVK